MLPENISFSCPGLDCCSCLNFISTFPNTNLFTMDIPTNFILQIPIYLNSQPPNFYLFQDVHS